MEKAPRPISQERLARVMCGASSIIPDRAAIEEKLLRPEKRPLRVKLGIDPTTSDLHFGYFVVLRRLRILQELGHVIVIVIGDFTARFGDPTDKLNTRTLRDAETVRKTASAYKEQIGLVLERKHVEFRFNSEWYDRMSAEELLRLMSEVTVAQMLERDMFRTRQEKGQPIGLHEPVYPVLQGYDSVQIEADLTVIGQDQLFNENVARTLQERRGQEPQMLIALEMIPGTDGGEKMSQSLGNEILLTASANEQFGKLMSIPDEAVVQYTKMLTGLDEKAIARQVLRGGAEAREAKAKLAYAIVEQVHGNDAASAAAAVFTKLFRDRELPEQIEEKRIDQRQIDLKALLVEVDVASSGSEAQRLVEQGGVRIDKETIKDPRLTITIPTEGVLLTVGKRTALRVLLREKK